MTTRSAAAGAAALIGLLYAAPGRADLLKSSGKLTFLRVHDVGTGFGPPADFIDVEVVTALHTRPGEFFGFQLRDDRQRAARQGMLDLLRDAFNHGWTVVLEYEVDRPKKQAVIIRVALQK
jgi:hypothetical protein